MFFVLYDADDNEIESADNLPELRAIAENADNSRDWYIVSEVLIERFH